MMLVSSSPSANVPLSVLQMMVMTLPSPPPPLPLPPPPPPLHNPRDRAPVLGELAGRFVRHQTEPR